MTLSKQVVCLLALLAVLCLAESSNLSKRSEDDVPYYSYNSLACNGTADYSDESLLCTTKGLNPTFPYPPDRKGRAESRTCTQTLPDDILPKLLKIFTDQSTPSIVSDNHDLYMNITTNGTFFKVTYLSADCSNSNSLGYFKYDWVNRKIIYNKDMGKNYIMYPGPFMFYCLDTNMNFCYNRGYTLEYGPFYEGETIGFYIGDDTFEDIYKYRTNHSHSNLGVDFVGRSSFSINSLNNKDYKPIHVWAYINSINMYLIGFDDNGYRGIRDLDYNDIIMLLEFNRANVSVIDPPEYNYEEERLNVCSNVSYLNTSLWLSRSRYIYTLLVPTLPSDCVNYLGFQSPWEWAKDDIDAMEAYKIASKSIWLPYIDNQLVFKSALDGSKQVSLDISGKRKVGNISYYGNDSSSDCVWVGCSSLIVVRKPSNSIPIIPSQCRLGQEEIYASKYRLIESVLGPDITVLTISGLTDKLVDVSTLHLLRPKFRDRTLELTFYYDFYGLSTSTIKNTLSPAMSTYLSSNLNTASGFYRTSINMYIHYSDSLHNYKKIGRANKILDLNGLFSSTLKINNLSSSGNPAKLLEGVTDVLDPLDPHIGYKAVVVFTASRWNEEDEAAFVRAVRSLGRQIVFIGPPSLQSQFSRLASKIPYMGYDTSNWLTNWYSCLFGSGATSLLYGYQSLRLYSVNETYDSWLQFNSTVNTSHHCVDMNPIYTVNWKHNDMKNLMNENDGVISADIAMIGWGVTTLEVRYNVPPVGRNLTVQCSSIECIINLPVTDSNEGNLLNIRINQLPSRGKLIKKQADQIVALNAGTFLNQFYDSGLPNGTIISTVYYIPTINGEYTFKYTVYDGCEYSQEYTVTIEVSRENTQIRSNHIFLTVGKDVTLINANPFTMAPSVIDPDPYEPIYVVFKQINTSVGTLYDKNKNPISVETRNITIHDNIYFVPSRTNAPGVTEMGALFYLVESIEGRNTSNDSWIYVDRTWSGESPPIIYFENSVINIYRSVQFTIVLECARGSLVDIYIEKLDAGNGIYIGDRLVVKGPVVSPTILLPSVKIPDDSFLVTISDLVWINTNKSIANGTEISGTFYALKQPGNESYHRSELAILHLTWKDTGNKNLKPLALATTVPPLTKGQNSSKFNLIGVDEITIPPGSTDFTFSIEAMPKDGELYRYDTNQPLSLGSATKADGTYFYRNETDKKSYYGSKLSVYYVPIRARNSYPVGSFTFRYRVFNLYKYSEWREVSFRIDDVIIPPISSNQDIYMVEDGKLDHIFPLIMNNGIMPGYLRIGDYNKTALYIGPTIQSGSSTTFSTADTDRTFFDTGDGSDGTIVIGSDTLEEATVHFITLKGIYSYKPGQVPAVYTKVNFKACDRYELGGTKGICSNDYTMNIYVQHTPHPPVSRDAVLKATRAVMLEVNLTAYDIDEYDKGKLVMRLYINSLKGKLYLDSKAKKPIEMLDGQYYAEVQPDLLYYLSNDLERDLQQPHDIFTYVLVDTTNLLSNKSKVMIYVNPRGDPPSTSLTEISTSQNMSYIFSLTSSKHVVVEQFGSSSARATITKLPEGTLLECNDLSCSSNVTITRVPYQLSTSGHNSSLAYISPPYKWGDALTNIRYTLTDVMNNKTSAEYTLTINVQHINVAPTFEVLNASFGVAGSLTLKQTDIHDFVWKQTDVDTLPKDLYAILAISLNPSMNWTLYKCLDENCTKTTPFIVNGGRDNDLPTRMDPSYIVDQDCKTEKDLYNMNGNLLENCYAYFKYRLYGDVDMLVTTAIGFSFVGLDKITYTTEHSIVVTHLLVNRPPTIWAPAKITAEKGTKNPFIRDTDMDSATYGRSVTLGDLGARSSCTELLTISSDTPGNFELPTSSADNCISSFNSSSSTSPVTVCKGTIENLNSWLSELRFYTEQTTATLYFNLSDEGCSSDVKDDQAYSTDATINLDLTATAGGSSNSKIVGIVAGSAATAGIALLGVSTYFFRQRLTSPPDVYFDIGNESVFTAPQNPLFQSNTREYSSSIYRNA